MPVPLERSVVVITGATSGIGRAAALAFARRGARLALAARSADNLEGLVGQCRAIGAEAIAVPTDVSDEARVEALAAAAEARFGGIDTWVSGAGVIAYGSFEAIPSEVFRRIIDVNLMGQVHGARAALPRFRRRGGGVLITMSSVWGRVSTPMVSPYVVSKNAVRAFAECLSQELADEDAIHVATMVPQAVDTPIFERAGNYTGAAVVPIPPMVDPEEVATGILACAEKPKREVNWGRTGRALEVLYSLAPRLYRRVAPGMFMRGSFLGVERETGPGNVIDSVGFGSVDGGWRRGRRRILARAFLRAIFGLLLGVAGRSSATRPPPPPSADPT